MTSSPDQDRTHESIINGELVRLLRDRCGLDAVAETLRDSKRPDIIVRLSATSVMLETELEPAATVEADALSRFDMDIERYVFQQIRGLDTPLVVSAQDI